MEVNMNEMTKESNIPKYLYKFYSPTIDNLNDIRNQRLWLALPKNFNDPYDGAVLKLNEKYLNMIINNIKMLKIDNKKLEADLETEYLRLRKKLKSPNDINSMLKILFKKYNFEYNEVMEKTNKEYKDYKDNIEKYNFRVACFTNFSRNKYILKRTDMWAYYAQDSNGFCVKYNRKKIKDENIHLYNSICKINYDDNIGKVPNDLTQLGTYLYSELQRKGVIWQHENEMRLILDEKSKGNKRMIKNGKIKFPYIDTIFVGFRASESLINELKSIGKSLEIPVYVLHLSEDEEMFKSIKII